MRRFTPQRSSFIRALAQKLAALLRAELVAAQATGKWPNAAQIAHAEAMLRLADRRQHRDHRGACNPCGGR